MSASDVEVGGAEVGGVFVRRVLVLQALVGVVTYMIVGLLAPWLLLVSDGLSQLWLVVLQAGGIGVLVSTLLAMQRLGQTRMALRAMALQPESVEPEHVGSLAALPFSLTSRFVLTGAGVAAVIVAPEVRPEQLDEARAISLALLTLTIVSAAAVVQFVVVRDATIRAIELCPLGPVTTWLEREALRLAPRQRVIRKILLAVVAPVALVGVGTLLVAQAQLRVFVEADRTLAAAHLAHAALDSLAGEVETGRDDGIAAAAAHGFFVQYQSGETLEPNHGAHFRTPGGQLMAHVPLEDGSASVRYTAELAPEVVSTGIWIALLAVALAVLFGAAFGRSLAKDLALATQQVSSLGTDVVLRGQARVAGPARFAVVAQLGRSVEELAERFRVFAAASERALQVRASGQRMKQLLFASVSHDLKSPLNAILGFAELVRDEPLTSSQLENLDLVSSRGRELLALIETILDAARVEAGQLQLVCKPMLATALINDAIVKAHDLHVGRRPDVVVELPRDMPDITIDHQHGVRAVAVLVAHAMDSAAGGRGRAIRVRGGIAGGGREGEQVADIHIEYAYPRNRPSLLEAQLRGHLDKAAGRGKVLRLGLARSIIELHGGRLEVSRGSHGAAVVTCRLPFTDPSVGNSRGEA